MFTETMKSAIEYAKSVGIGAVPLGLLAVGIAIGAVFVIGILLPITSSN